MTSHQKIETSFSKSIPKNDVVSLIAPLNVIQDPKNYLN